MKVLYLLSIILFLASSFAQENTTDLPSTTVPTSTETKTSEKTTPTTQEPTSPPTTTPKSTSPPTTTPKPTSPPTTTPKPTSPPTTTPKPTSPPTTTPKPTSPPPTTTPETTTPKTTTPQTTTPQTTTTPKTTTPQTTTPAPKTTSPVPVTTKSPIPDVEEGSWNVTSGNTTCIRANLKILFKIEMGNRQEYIALSKKASSDKSNCNGLNGTQELTLTDSNYSLQFIFEKKGDSVYVKNTSFTYYIDFSETARNDSQMFTVKPGNSYLCTVESDVLLDSNVTMEIMSVKMQAFGAEHNQDFGTAEECEADNKVNDIVPIAVGIALLALVVVVLIAYLIGRRRSRQKGYQSV